MFINIDMNLFFYTKPTHTYENKIIFFSYADQVSTEDEILVQGGNEPIPTKVKNVATSLMQGKHQFCGLHHFSCTGNSTSALELVLMKKRRKILFCSLKEYPLNLVLCNVSLLILQVGYR